MNTTKTGVILLVHGNSKQAKIIQKFQQIADKPSGYYNHSGILFETINGLYVVEETQIKGRSLKAAAVITPIEHYINSDYELLFLWPKTPINDPVRFERILLEHVGIPYDYFSLIHDQVIRTLHDKWVGRKKDKAWKRMVCHEFMQYIWELYMPGIFPEYFKGDVSKAYHSDRFNHIENS